VGRVSAVVCLAVLAGIVPGAATPASTRVAGSSGSWFWATADHTLETVKLDVDKGAAQLIVAPEAKGVEIKAVTGPVKVSAQTPLPHPFVGLDAIPAVGAGGTLQFTIQTSAALPASTVISVQIYPQKGSGAGLEQVNVTEEAATPLKKTPNLDKAITDVEDAITFEQKAESAYSLSYRKSDLAGKLGQAQTALNAALQAGGAAVVDDELSTKIMSGYVKVRIDRALGEDAQAGKAAASSGTAKARAQQVKSVLAGAEADKESALITLKIARGQAQTRD
jgi:hypothetical protein